jgi:hypothetical protein
MAGLQTTSGPSPDNESCCDMLGTFIAMTDCKGGGRVFGQSNDRRQDVILSELVVDTDNSNEEGGRNKKQSESIYI